MSDPWSDAVDLLFAGDGSEAASFEPQGGAPYEIRVIRTTPDQQAELGGRIVVLASTQLELRRSEVPNPVDGDHVYLADQLYRLSGDPKLDDEGVTWFCGAEPE